MVDKEERYEWVKLELSVDELLALIVYMGKIKICEAKTEEDAVLLKTSHRRLKDTYAAWRRTCIS